MFRFRTRVDDQLKTTKRANLSSGASLTVKVNGIRGEPSPQYTSEVYRPGGRGAPLSLGAQLQLQLR